MNQRIYTTEERVMILIYMFLWWLIGILVVASTMDWDFKEYWLLFLGVGIMGPIAIYPAIDCWIEDWKNRT